MDSCGVSTNGSSSLFVPVSVMQQHLPIRLGRGGGGRVWKCGAWLDEISVPSLAYADGLEFCPIISLRRKNLWESHGKKSMGKPWAASIIKHQSIPPNIAPYLTSKINNFSAKPRFPVAVWELPGGGRSGSEGPLSGHGYHLRLPASWVGATLAAAAATALLGDVDAGSKC